MRLKSLWPVGARRLVRDSSFSSGVKNGCDSFLSDIRKHVQSGNQWMEIERRTQRENYMNGDRNLLMVFSGLGRSCKLSDQLGSWINSPDYILTCAADAEVLESAREIGDKRLHLVRGKAFEVGDGDQESVFVENIESMNGIEKPIPSRFSMWLQRKKRINECRGNPTGYSLRHSITQACPVFGKGELDTSPFSIGGSKLPDAIPIRMIESGTEIVYDIANNDARAIYRGFVTFYESGAFAGFDIRFEDVVERMAFAKSLLQIDDVFVGPIDLQSGTVHIISFPIKVETSVA